MLFNSFEYLVFLPVVFLLYWFVVNKKLEIQNAFIVVVSYIFYGWWDWRFLILIAITSFASWLSGIWMLHIRQTGENPAVRNKKCKWITAGNIVLNIGILGFFKYYNFFVDNFVEVFGFMGIKLHVSTLRIILPVGISFYTFQALSYSIDVYRDKLKPTKDIIAFFAFVSFFPQLVAGPIERATSLLVQFYHKRTFVYKQAVDGIRQIIWGFFKKMVIADNCSVVVDDIFGNYANYSGSTLVLGALLFSFQIYGDFSGYSDIAIGTAKLFGIELRRNFHYPYFSRNIMEFWRRWHISLNTWFLDYIYIPLGGSREGRYKHIRNILLVFFLSGLWHGAAWTFIVWGLYYGLLFIPLVLLGVRVDTKVPQFKNIGSILGAFMIVMFGWIIFRAENMMVAMGYLQHMFDKSLFHIPKAAGVNNVFAILSLFFILILLSIEWMNRGNSFGLDLKHVPNNFLRYSIYTFILFAIYFFGADSSSFIYFQF